jgi:hypothetical protein
MNIETSTWMTTSCQLSKQDEYNGQPFESSRFHKDREFLYHMRNYQMR